MIKVKYNEKYSQDGYKFRAFDTYEDFGFWYIHNRNDIIVWDIKVN